MSKTWKPQEARGAWAYEITFLDQHGRKLLTVWRSGSHSGEALNMARNVQPNNARIAKVENMNIGGTSTVSLVSLR